VRGRLGVARSFGDSQFDPLVTADPYIVKYRLSDEDDFLLLACDGVFDVYQDQDLVDTIEVLSDFAKSLTVILF
jgi:protein phosphatase PTC1